MSVTEQTSKQYFLRLNIIYFALLLGQVLFLAVTLFLTFGQTESEDNPFRLILPVVVVGGITASTFVSRALINKAKAEDTLKSKLMRYSSAIIVRCALLEGPCLFAVVAFLTTANHSLLLYAAVCLTFFLLNKPSRGRLISELELSAAEKEMVEDPLAIVAEVRQTNY